MVFSEGYSRLIDHVHHTMMGTEDADLIPVRENGIAGPGKRGGKTLGEEYDTVAQHAAQERRMVGKWGREDLEDRYLRMYEENLLLKKHGRKQEEKIKRMATKLLRLVSDKKKADQQSGVKKTRDIETEEMLEELHGKIRELEKQNVQLKEKLIVSKQQLTSQGTRKTVYGHVQSRINTGIPKPPADPRIARSMRVTGPPVTRTVQNPGLPRYGQSLLDEAREENKHLEDIIGQQQEQMNIYEQDIEMLKEQMKVREADYEEDLLKIKQQMSHGQRAVIQENIDVIRLQRELKEKSTKMTQLQAKYSNMDDKLRTVKNAHDQLLLEMETLNHQLKEEQNRRLSAENEMKKGGASQRALIEFQERINDLEKECDILKDANEKLVSSAFDLEREREWRQKENALKVQIAQLEATLKADVGEKGGILDKLTEERDKFEGLEEEHRELRISYFQVKQELDDLRDKMRFFTQESAVDFQEIEEALMIVKQRKEKDSQNLDFLQDVEDEKEKDLGKLVREMRAEHADTINELEKTRNLLIVQHKINKDYQQEVEAVTNRMEENKTEYETRLQEYAQLLDIRAARIRKMEQQLRDVAYGTKQYRIRPEVEADEGSDVEDYDETIHLERGQNLFEIHVKNVSLNSEALRALGDDEPQLFCTWEFYEFEIQSTPVLRGPRPDYQFTSQYLVKVDDFFLHYLQKESCTIELHQSIGTDYRTLAAAQLQMREILDRSHGRLHRMVELTGVDPEGSVANYGTLEYWIRLRVPMEQAMRLYKERSKALGYLDSNIRTSEQALQALDESAAQRPPDNVNELHVKIIRCHQLQGRRDGVQPSPYCVYKFFDFGDHDTAIVESSNNPEFNDHKTFHVPMTADLDKYLKAQAIQLYVFDDADPSDAEYIGLATIPLLPLAHDKSIQGNFELKKNEGVTGTVEVSLKWHCSYLPPKASTRTAAQALLANGDEATDNIHMLPGEQEALQQSAVVSEAPTTLPRTSTARRPPRAPAPAAASTPLPHRQAVAAEGSDQTGQDFLIQPISAAEAASMPEQEEDLEGSIVSEGTPIPGESEPVSSTSELASSRADEPPPGIEVTPPSPNMAVPQPPLRARREDQEQYYEHEEEEEIEEQVSRSMRREDMDDTLEREQSEYGESEEEVEEEIEEGIVEGDDAQEYSAAETEDSDGVVMGTPTPRPHSSLASIPPSELVTIAISHLSLEPDSHIQFDDQITKLYVEYTFLGVPREETETPYSLPKPAPNKQISFNFTKTFHVDFRDHYERRQYLASMLLPTDSDLGRIKFMVVSEPEEEEADCDDVGVAYVNIPEILEQKRDLEDENIPIYDVEDESECIGQLCVTVKCLAALEAVQQEMQGVDNSLDA